MPQPGPPPFLDPGPKRPRRLLRLLGRVLAVALLMAAVAATAVAGYEMHEDRSDATATAAAPDSQLVPGAVTAESQPTTAPAITSAEGMPALLPALVSSSPDRGNVPGVRARAAIVVDVGRGEVLWARREHRRLPVASLTKMMTALVAVQDRGLSEVVSVTPAMTRIGGSSLYLKAGQRITVQKLLDGALIVSGNDAANALAIHRAGTVTAFVQRMNAQAQRLGLKESRFSSPSGLLDRGNRSSAFDLADIARYLLADEVLASATRSRTFAAPRGATWLNHNKLLFSYRGAIGLKTGYTLASGPCLAAAAHRDGRTLVAILLGARGDEFAMARQLLDRAFAR